MASAVPYSFITFGDWGTGSALQKDGAAAVNAFCATPGACEQVIGLAECVGRGLSSPPQPARLLHPPLAPHTAHGPRSNFYNGPLTTEDPRWRTDFQDMYNFCEFPELRRRPGTQPLALLLPLIPLFSPPSL